MDIWQADFYYLPSAATQWELIICEINNNNVENSNKQPKHTAQCNAKDANAAWIEQQIIIAAEGKLPSKIQFFRPQIEGILTIVGEKLGIKIEATRNTEVLKKVLKDKYQQQFPNYNPLALDKPPPQPLPENLWGEEWQIGNIIAGQIVELFRDRPLPICSLPDEFLPINLAIASDIFIPGIIIYGGRKSMQLAHWIENKIPDSINYIPTEVGQSGGFILETGLVDRWVFNTFESPQAATIANSYEQKKQAAKGLHFLLIQPDNSGMTYTAFWLLKESL